MATVTASAADESDPGAQEYPFSRTINASGYSVTVYKDWTCNWGTTGSSSDGCFGGSSRVLSDLESTPSFADWDVLRVDAGFCYRVEFQLPWKIWTVTYDQSDRGHVYVKIEDFGVAYVEAQRYDGCP